MAPVKSPIEQLFAKLNIDEKCLQYPSACTIKYTTALESDKDNDVDNSENDTDHDIIISEANFSIADFVTNLALVYTTNDNLSQTLQEYSTTQNVNATLNNALSDYSTTYGNDLKYATIANVVTAFGNYTTTGNDTNYAKATDLTNTNNNLANNYTKTGQDSTYAKASNLASYVTNSSLSSTLNAYAKTSDLSSYVKTTDLTNYVTQSSLATTLNNYGLNSNTIQINAINNIVTYLQLLEPFAIYDNVTEDTYKLYNNSWNSAVNGSTNKPSIANFDTNCSSRSLYGTNNSTACYFVQQYQFANGQLQSNCITANNNGCLTLPDITTLKTIPTTRLFDDLRNESINDNYSIELNDRIQHTTLHDFKHALSLSGVAVYSF